MEAEAESPSATLAKKEKKSGFEFAGENGFAEFGGYMDAKISKLEQQFSCKTNMYKESDLFSGISIYVNGLTNPSADELKRIMMKHGGVYHHYERSHTKYMIASNLPDVKIRNHTTKTIIRPEWITKCLSENRIVDYSNYLLITNRNQNQPTIHFKSKPSVEQKCHDIKSANVETETIAGPATTSTTKNQTRSANDANFLTEFYNNSRLHHISTLGATFKQHITQLRRNHNNVFPARDDLIAKIPMREAQKGVFIMHIDMDCFFVSVGLRNRPDLVGVPVAVTHSKGKSVQDRPGVDFEYERQVHERKLSKAGDGSNTPASFFATVEKNNSLSEIASCSYEARKMGIKNGMFVGAALKLCPNLKTIPYDFDGYKDVAFTLYNTISKYTLDIEAVSCDEMYVDLTSILEATNVPVMDFVAFVRNEIQAQTLCCCSAGVGANRIQARMATKEAKPNGQFHLQPHMVEEYFKSIPVSDLPGVGRNTSYKLAQHNWETCGDLQKVRVQTLQNELGKKLGEALHNMSHGRDEKTLNFGQIRKSVSAEVNYGIRFNEKVELESFLNQLCTEVHDRLTEISRRGKCITLKYMVRAADAPVETAKFMGHGICDVVNKSHTLPEYTSSADTINRTVLRLNKEINIPVHELRGIGIQILKLDEVIEDSVKKNSNLKNMFLKIKDNEFIPKENRTNSLSIKITPGKLTTPIKRTTPVKSGRGRPKKTSTIKSRNLSEMWKEAREIQTDNDEMDMAVINELPEEFRAEAIQCHKLSMKRFTSDGVRVPEKSPTKIDENFLAALPPDIRREVELDMRISPPKESSAHHRITSPPDTKTISETNIFLHSNWRSLMQEWITSSDGPFDNHDVEMVISSLIEFIKGRRLDEVYVSFRFMYRIMKEYPAWYNTYNEIVAQCQGQVLNQTGYKLAIMKI